MPDREASLVPREIIKAIDNNELAVFIGAGVSALVGCDRWDKLAQNLLECCYEREIINYWEKEKLSSDSDHKKVITICFRLLEKRNLKDVFFDRMRQALKDNEEVEIPNIYDDIFQLRGLFITTNADRHFDRFFDVANIVHKVEDFDPNRIDRTKLYHIHGSISDPDNMVFTVHQYIQRYGKEKFANFLKKIFDQYTVLFIGYGLTEFELLDYIFTKFDPKDNPKSVLKHFALRGFYRNERAIVDFEQEYYNDMGIRILTYWKDEKGYQQLCEEMKLWSTEINQTSSYLDDSFVDIDQAIMNPNPESIQKALQIARNTEALEDYLFRKLAETTLPVPWLEPLKERGYLDSNKNPPPEKVSDTGYRIPVWNMLRFVENLADRNSEDPKPNVTNELCSFMESVISYLDKNGERVDNYYTDWTIVKVISTLPTQKIKTEYIDFVGTALQSKWSAGFTASEIGKTLLPHLVDKKAEPLVLRLLDVMLNYKHIDSEFKPIMEEYWLGDALKKHLQSIAELCPLKAAEIALKKIQSIVREDKAQFNIVWITTIEPYQQTGFPDRLENQLVSFVRDMLQFTDPDNIRTKVESLIAEEHPIFRRIAMHTINRHFRRLQDLFWNWPDGPLSDFRLHHEVYELLKANCKILNENQIDKVLDWIESKKYSVSEWLTGKEEREKAIAYKKREYLSALLDCGNAKVVEKYRIYEKINPVKLEHPGFLTWTEFSWGTVSPIEANVLTDMSNADIAQYLNSFKEDRRDLRGPTKEGLIDILRISATAKPQEFSSDMEPFKSVDLVYQSVILSGLCEAWRQGESLEWKQVLNFSSEIIQRKCFLEWRRPERGWDYKDWVMSAIADLINEGTQKDDRSFNQELLPKAEQILLVLVDQATSDLEEERDILTRTLNSPKGKVFSAMVNYSLCVARLEKKSKGQRWAPKIKEQFNKRLQRDSGVSLEFSVVLGEYLRNLAYLDEEWVKKNINEIFPRDKEEHWRAAFTSYLFYARTIYKEAYFLLRKNKHYEKAIVTEFVNRHTNEHCVQRIIVGFLEGWEKLDEPDSLINKLLQNKKTDQLSEIINFLWRIGATLTDERKKNVRPLWKAMFDLLQQMQDDPEYQNVITQMSMFLALFDTIDKEILEWLKFSTKCTSESYHLHNFIELLADHVEKTPDHVAQIYRKILANDTYPVFPKEKIEHIVETLYQKGQKDSANRICNMYFGKGFYFLRNLYEKYRKNGDE